MLKFCSSLTFFNFKYYTDSIYTDPLRRCSKIPFRAQNLHYTAATETQYTEWIRLSLAIETRLYIILMQPKINAEVCLFSNKNKNWNVNWMELESTRNITKEAFTFFLTFCCFNFRLLEVSFTLSLYSIYAPIFIFTRVLKTNFVRFCADWILNASI